MEKYWTCLECGSANLYPDITECEVCGKTIDNVEISRVNENIKQIENRIAVEKQREKEEKIQKQREIKAAEHKLKLQKINDTKVKFRRIWCLLEKYWGFIVSGALLIGFIVETVIKATMGHVHADWIFCLVAVALSVGISYFSQTIVNEYNIADLSKIIPSGFLGAYVFASSVGGLWKDEVQGITQAGFFVTFFIGPIILILFLLFAAIFTLGIVSIAQFLPLYIQKKTSGSIGGIIGFCISSVLLILYVVFTTGSVWRII